jgi:hypothetical protein
MTTNSREEEDSESLFYANHHHRDRSEWKVPKIIECPVKESDRDETATLATSSLSSNSLGEERRATGPNLMVIVDAFRDLHEEAHHHMEEIRRKNEEIHRLKEELGDKNEEIRRLQMKEYILRKIKFDEWEGIQHDLRELRADLCNPALDEKEKIELRAESDLLKKRKAELAFDMGWLRHGMALVVLTVSRR